MERISEESVISGLKEKFKDWFKIEPEKISVEKISDGESPAEPQLKIEVMDHPFRVCYSTKTEYSSTISLADKLRALLKEEEQPPLLIVVPFMPEKGKDNCEGSDLSWMDLSGNAHIQEPPLYVHVEGKGDRFKQSGRPPSVFAPKASKISSMFLLNSKKSFTVKELVKKTGVSSGTVSRITRRLEDLGFLQEEDKKGRAKPYKLLNPFTMLDAWAEDYDFNKHEVMKGALAETRNKNFLKSVQKMLSSYTEEYSLSGPRVAEFYDVPGESSLTVAYVKKLPSQIDLENMDFKPGDRGANLWLARPSSDGPFMETKSMKGIKVVNRIQMYLDLASIKAQRSEELAEELYKKIRQDFRDAGF